MNGYSMEIVWFLTGAYIFSLLPLCPQWLWDLPRLLSIKDCGLHSWG